MKINNFARRRELRTGRAHALKNKRKRWQAMAKIVKFHLSAEGDWWRRRKTTFAHNWWKSFRQWATSFWNMRARTCDASRDERATRTRQMCIINSKFGSDDQKYFEKHLEKVCVRVCVCGCVCVRASTVAAKAAHESSINGNEHCRAAT